MATSPLRLQQGYGIGNALQPLPPFSIIANRAPTQQDKARIGTFWVYTALNNVYVLTSVTGGVSNWLTLSNGGAGVFLSLTVNGPSTFAGNITQTAGVTSLLATTVSSLICNGNLTTNIGAVTINAPAVPVTSSLTVFGQNTAAQASLVIEATVNGVHNAIQAYNLDNVNAASCEIAVVTASQDGAGGRIGDSQVRFTSTIPLAPGTVEFTIGKDASANDFVISQGPSLGTNDRLTIDGATGAVNLPAQPSFCAVITAASAAGVTGNGTNYVLGSNAEATPTVYTKLYESTPGIVDAQGRFIAPVAGRYLFTAGVRMSAYAGVTNAQIQILAPTTIIVGSETCPPAALTSFFAINTSGIINLAQGAPVSVRINCNGQGADNTVVQGDGANLLSYFTGALLN